MPDRTTSACGAVRKGELEAIDQAAASRGMTRSEFVRSACLIMARVQAQPDARRRMHRVVSEVLEGDGPAADADGNATQTQEEQ